MSEILQFNFKLIKMGAFTTLDKTDILNIEELYQLEIDDFYPITENGLSNSNFILIIKGQKHILTIVEDGVEDKADLVTEILLHLNKYKYATNKVLTDVNQKAINTIHGKPYFIKDYIEGEVIMDMNLEQIKEAGKALAKLHLVPNLSILSTKYQTESPQFQEPIGMGFDVKYEEWLVNQLERFKPILAQDLPKGIIHGDLFADNVIFNDDGAVIIDFECSCHYFFVFDIGMAFIGSCLDDYQFNSAKAKAFLEGYQEVRILEPLEVENVQLFTEYAATLMSIWRFWNYNYFRPRPERADWHRLLVDAGRQISEIPTATFLKTLF